MHTGVTCDANSTKLPPSSRPLLSSKYTGLKYTPEANVGWKISLGIDRCGWTPQWPPLCLLRHSCPKTRHRQRPTSSTPALSFLLLRCALSVPSSAVCVYMLTAACHQDSRQELHKFSMNVWDELTCFLQVLDPGKVR